MLFAKFELGGPMAINESISIDNFSKIRANDMPVICLGLKFKNETERRTYFISLLREKLKDPKFRAIEGFPKGSDDDILELSDPPYFTACPNPFLEEFIKLEGNKYDPKAHYSKKPFAADVNEGKTHPLYSAMAYHTKVPHRAIMRYILHYTDPGDVVLDCFCGTGMTGVAAQMCADKKEAAALGYKVVPDGTLLQKSFNERSNEAWEKFSIIGERKCILADLSPAATYISKTYNSPIDIFEIEKEVENVYHDLFRDYGWMYKTLINGDFIKSSKNRIINSELCNSKNDVEIRAILNHYSAYFGDINYTLWSDVYSCSNCGGEIILWNTAVDKESASLAKKFPCHHCNATLAKNRMERIWLTEWDKATNSSIRISKQVPVLINFSFGNKRYEKIPDSFDLELIRKVNQIDISNWFPCDMLPVGVNTAQPKLSHGLTRVHHFYHHRSLVVFAQLYSKCKDRRCAPIVFNMITRVNKQSSLHVSNYFKKGGGVCKGHLTGTLYIPSISPELPVTKVFKDRTKTFLRGMKKKINNKNLTLISTQSAGELEISDDSIDYIFVDPPFGANLNYSEVNWNEESWLKVWTNSNKEAIENKYQGKGLNEYRNLMTACFKETYRVLKPGRWMTVEFSNTRAAVWNSIQTALSDAGFIVANVSALNKKQGSFKAVNTPTAVKQDLVISAYKPNGGFETRFSVGVSTEEGVWDFVRTHLQYLPVTKFQGEDLVALPERDSRILYDKIVAYYVLKGHQVPISSPEFQIGLSQRFIQRDNMYFLPEQAAEYDKRKIYNRKPFQSALFVSDELTAIQWLRDRLTETPQKYNEIHPDFTPLLGHVDKQERNLLSLDLLLGQNFLCYDGKGEVPNQIHSYLFTNFKELKKLAKEDPLLQSKAKDRWYVPDPNKVVEQEKLRERALLKEFHEYLESKQKRLKVFRLEAVRAGFKKAWQEKDYNTIIEVARKIKDEVLQEDPKLLMFYDQALTRSEQS
jgi:hypothetical protein